MKQGGAGHPTETRRAVEAEWVVFACGASLFGLPIRRVREIGPLRPATRLPGCGPEVLGLVALRGRAVTAFDFGPLFGLAGATPGEDARLLLVEHGERVVGFAVDRVHGVARGGGETLPVDRETLHGLDVSRDDVAGFGTYEGEAFVAVDVDPILGRLLV